MEELELEEGETVKRLCDFLPSDLRMKIFRAVEEHYKNAAKRSLVTLSLERFVGVELQDIKEDDALNEYFPRILAFALINIPQVREVLKTDFLEEIETLCRDLGISGEGKIVGTRRQKNNPERFMEHIDGKSREIIWYLLRNRYAGIRDLSDLIGASADNEVLTRIREVINPAAKKFLGKEILEFKESGIDESSGKKVVFKWWLKDDLQLTEKKEELLDVFDEGDKIRIIAELPPVVEEKDIKVEVNNDIVKITANTSNGKYERIVPLFFAGEKAIEKTYKNGILEVRLIKKSICLPPRSPRSRRALR
ncbi:MAG: Hsp20/alpha crystallin family protein [Methanomicrobia archaeon]|nr:Hsp20/alpha crystallin family protein [Methanomicrobia archaeon]